MRAASALTAAGYARAKRSSDESFFNCSPCCVDVSRAAFGAQAPGFSYSTLSIM